MPRAWVCREWGSPSKLVQCDVPELTSCPAGKVVVRILTSGIDFVQTLLIQNKYQRNPPLPFTPGAEITGLVKLIGEGVEGFKAGDLVLVGAPYGGFQEEYMASARACRKLPEGMDVRRVPSLYGYNTALFALRDRARLQPGETLLVIGAAGGVGITAVELGKMMGARVIAAASSDEKLEVCRRYGADHLINYTREDLKTRLREVAGFKVAGFAEGQGTVGGKPVGGVDVIYDPVGDRYAEPAIRNMAAGGRYLVIGFAGGEIPRIPVNLLLLKNSYIVGSGLGEFQIRDPEGAQRMGDEIMQWAMEGKIRPFNSCFYAFGQAAQGLQDIMERRVAGKALVTTPLFEAMYGDPRRASEEAMLPPAPRAKL